jgi:site-specific recombinase XerD
MNNTSENVGGSGELVCGLPDEQQVCEWLLRLPAPYQLMAWIVVETGLRLAEVAALPVRAFAPATRTVTVADRACPRRFVVSPGLSSALADHLVALRPRFEGQGTRTFRMFRATRVAEPVRFSDALLFPAWTVRGHARTTGNRIIPVPWIVDALDQAAGDAGFVGVIHSNTLRHACIKRWLDQGLSIGELHERLGHRDLMTTLLLAQTLRHGGLTFTSAA